MTLTDMAVATSGNYEKFVMIGGKKYSHTINPRTGLPVTGIKSVTIITTNAEIADAMGTPVTIMGVKAGLNLINQMNQIEAIIIDDDNRLYTSNNININTPVMKKSPNYLLLMIPLVLAASSCMNLRAYQKSRLNDAEMVLGNRKVEKNELNFQSYREAASGAN